MSAKCNLFVFLMVAMLCSCSSEKTPKELFDMHQSGVCMVLNSYYYEITLPNGSVWYCTGIDEDGDLENFALDESEAKSNRQMATGTAFFIDNKGTLMTNRHVVSPDITEDVIKKAASNLIGTIKDYAEYLQLEYAQQYQELEDAKSDCYYLDYSGNVNVNRDQLYKIVAAQEQLEQDFSDAQDLISSIKKMNLSHISVRPINEIGIAYNDTYVTKIEDFLLNNPCVVTKISDDEEIDLALIQLKNKNTPEGKFIFNIKGRDEIKKGFLESIVGIFSSDKNGELAVDQQLVMIGFNAGLILGNTQQGIQAQMTTGRISQMPNKDKILYSIPTLQGSSGSPVLDLNGYVRAVNFAKLRGTDTFNFGIPEGKIIDFLNN